jgi:hypothetical protein
MITNSPSTRTAVATLPRPVARQGAMPTPGPTPGCAASGRDHCAVCAAAARGDYLDMPGLSLTREQAARLWRLDGPLAEAVLEHLTCEGFLRKTVRDTYVRADLARP